MKIRKAVSKFGANVFRSKPVVTSMAAAMLVAGMSVSAFASETAYSTMGESLKTGFSEMITETVSVASGLVPVAIPLMGLSILVAYVIRFIKKITK